MIETGNKKQILKNNSNIFKDWTISREVKSFRLKQTVKILIPQRSHANIQSLSITLDTGWIYDLNLIERLRF